MKVDIKRVKYNRRAKEMCVESVAAYQGKGKISILEGGYVFRTDIL